MHLVGRKTENQILENQTILHLRIFPHAWIATDRISTHGVHPQNQRIHSK